MIPGLVDAVKGGFSGIFEGAASIIERFKADPTKVVETQAELEKLRITADTEAAKVAATLEETYAKELETVNATMREEAKSEHWLQWSWRPVIGYTFAATILNNYILLPYLQKHGAVYIEIPSEITMALLAILGVASAGRSVKGTKWGK